MKKWILIPLSIIIITLAVVTIIWEAIIPQTSPPPPEWSCDEADGRILEGNYTCINNTNINLKVGTDYFNPIKKYPYISLILGVIKSRKKLLIMMFLRQIAKEFMNFR